MVKKKRIPNHDYVRNFVRRRLQILYSRAEDGKKFSSDIIYIRQILDTRRESLITDTDNQIYRTQGQTRKSFKKDIENGYKILEEGEAKLRDITQERLESINEFQAETEAQRLEIHENTLQLSKFVLIGQGGSILTVINTMFSEKGRVEDTDNLLWILLILMVGVSAHFLAETFKTRYKSEVVLQNRDKFFPKYLKPDLTKANKLWRRCSFLYIFSGATLPLSLLAFLLIYGAPYLTTALKFLLNILPS